MWRGLFPGALTDQGVEPARASRPYPPASADYKEANGEGRVTICEAAPRIPLRVSDVDLASGVIRVERGWDEKEGEIELKTAAGRRRVPIAVKLRDHLVEHKIATGREEDDLLFGRTAEDAFNGKNVQDRADTAWARAGLERITPHECRHSYASTMIAAGVNAKALSTFMGHANISITLDRYGHLMPGSEDEAAALLDAYLEAKGEAAAERARAASSASGKATSAVDPSVPSV